MLSAIFFLLLLLLLFFFYFYVFINSFDCWKSYFDCNLLYLSGKTFKTKYERPSLANLYFSEKIRQLVTIYGKCWSFFSKVTALIFAQKCVKCLRFTKIVKQIKSKGLRRVRSKKVFPEIINHKIFETNSNF